jgi:hypothetical protein
MEILLRQVCSGSCSLFSFKNCVFVAILSHECGREKGRHWPSSLCQCKATYSGLLPGFPEASLRSHHPCAIHPFNTD